MVKCVFMSVPQVLDYYWVITNDIFIVVKQCGDNE